VSGPEAQEPLALALDAATYVGTVAVVRGSTVLAECEVAMRGERAERLMPAVAAALAQARVTVRELEAVVCGAGPGSFTSLRIAAAIAKGIAAARHVPLHARSSLALLIAAAATPLPDGVYVPALDAMRGEVFAAVVTVAGGAIADEGPLHRMAERDLGPYARRLGARVVGPGRELDLRPHARGVTRDAVWRRGGGRVSLTDWEPDYGRLAEAQVQWEAAHGRPLRAL
jgi:tRNA threonylcarbamoyladenosine biosynthesis protein TsaB